MDFWLLTVVCAQEKIPIEFETKADLDKYMVELTKQIEQNSYNDGFVPVYIEEDYQYFSRISEIVAFEVMQIKRKKKWFQTT